VSLRAQLDRLRGDLRGRALWVVLGALVCQMGLAYGYAFGPIQDPVRAELGWSRTEWSAAVGARIPINAVLQAAVGFLAVRLGASAVLTSACIVGAVAFVGISQMQQLWQLYALIPLVGLLLASFSDVTAGHVVTRWIQRGRGLALGIVYVGSNLGAAVVVPLTAWLTAAFSWRVACLVIGLGLGAFLLPFARLAVREPRAGEGARDVGGGGAEGAAQTGDLRLRQAVRTRSFWLLGLNLFATFCLFVAMTDQLIPILTDRGVSPLRASAVFALITGFVGSLTKIGVGLVADRISAKLALVVNSALLALSSLLLFLLPAPWALALFVAAYGISSTARDVLYPLIIVHCFGVRYMAEIYGVLMLNLVAGTLGSVAAAAAREHLGSYDRAFVLFVGLNLAALAAAALVRPERDGDGRRERVAGRAA
jgi:nitrate/nitrite transporter NarK